MSVELFLHKRPARHVGEIGLFSDAAVFADEWATIPADTEVRAELSTERNARLLKFAWVLAGIVADNTEFYVDKADCMDSVDPPGLKILARHCKAVVNPETGEITIKPRSLRNLSNEALARVVRRMLWAVTNTIIVGMDEGPLRAEIEEILRDRREPKP